MVAAAVVPTDREHHTAGRFFSMMRIKTRVAVFLLIGLALVARPGSSSPLAATELPSAPTPVDGDPVFLHPPRQTPSPAAPQANPLVVRIAFDDDVELRALVRALDVWEVHRDRGYLVAMIETDRLTDLQRAGYQIELDAVKTARLSAPRPVIPGQSQGIPGYPCYRTVEETYAAAQALAAAHPQLAQWIDVGDSWEKSVTPTAGYHLWVLRLTNAAIPGPKPRLFVVSAIHAREYAPAELNVRFAEHLVANYDVDADVTWLLDHHEIHLLLHANPDGRKYAETGQLWRKNTNNNYCPNTGARGADLNRNFEFRWNCCGGSSGLECHDTYHGPSAASEPEVQAIQAYLRARFPDQRAAPISAAAPLTATGMFVDLHSYGELVLWPWGFQSAPPPNGSGLATLGARLAAFTGYQAQPAYQLYPTDGDSTDFAYGELGLPAFVVELGTDFFQGCSSFEQTILPANLQALLYAARVVRTPYLTPAGPDVTDLQLDVQDVVQGQPAHLSADVIQGLVASSSGTGAAEATVGHVAAAEYYLDAPPWVTTTIPVSHTLAAADGSFDSPVETVLGTVDTTGLSLGRHTVFVRSQAAGALWGPFSAVFLNVVESPATALIDGYVRDAGTNAALQATVSAGQWQTQTEGATGYYALRVVSGTHDLSVAGPPGYVTTTLSGVFVSGQSRTRQDAYLYTTCERFVDDVESGSAGWTADAPWAITEEASHSASHSWTDSPGSQYGAQTTASLQSPIFDLSASAGTALRFWHLYDLCADGDRARVEYSTDGGASWTSARSFSGHGPITWTQEAVPLPLLDGQPQSRLRFSLSSGPWGTADGWHIDDVLLVAGGLDCVMPLPPAAAFTHTVALPGDPVRFSNLTRGTPPFETRWDFGDGSQRSGEGDPFHTYAAAGTFSVTLAVTNALGSSQIAHPVMVLGSDLARTLYLPVLLKH